MCSIAMYRMSLGLYPGCMQFFLSDWEVDVLYCESGVERSLALDWRRGGLTLAVRAVFQMKDDHEGLVPMETKDFKGHTF